MTEILGLIGASMIMALTLLIGCVIFDDEEAK